MMRGIVIGFLLAVLFGTAGVYSYFRLGLAPTAVADPPMPFEKYLARTALKAHIKKQKVAESSVPADEENLHEGAQVYKKNCASCHGLPNQPPSSYERTMFPKPPQLFRGKGVTDDPPAESYWKAANGIRLSGMPSFTNQLTDTQLWQVSQLVAHADDLPSSVKLELAPSSP